MALTVPTTLEAAERPPTDGERRTFELLRRGLDDDHWVWFDQKINGERPDFVIFGPSLGLVVLEVKDWKRERLAWADPTRVRLFRNGGDAMEAHPLERAATYVFRVTDELKKQACLRHSSGQFQGKLRFPWATGAVMTHWSERFLEEAKLEHVFPRAKLLLEEDLHHPDPPRLLRERLPAMFDHWFPPVGIGPREIQALRSALCPEVVLRRPERRNPPPAAAGAQAALPGVADAPAPALMDLAQERLAKSLGDGHRVIRGVAGSGKTRVLMARAVHLCRAHPGWTVGYFCYNLALAAWVRDTLRISAPDVADRIEVRAFLDWAGEALRPTGGIPPGAYESDEWPTELCGALETGALPPPFEALMVDEAQDFRERWLAACTRIVKRSTGMLVLAADGAQSVYKRSFTWKGAGIAASGRTTILEKNHRNTREIATLAARFRRLAAHRAFGEEVLPIDDFELGEARGPAPRIWRLRDLDEEARFVAAQCKRLYGATPREVEPGEIGIAYRARTRGDRDLLAPVLDELRSAWVPHAWLTEGPGHKLRFADRGPNVIVSTIHSLKGLDLDTLFLTNPVMVEAADSEHHLFYVALTRARRRLFVTYVDENQITQRILDAAAGRGAPTGVDPHDRASLVRLGLAKVPLTAAEALSFAGVEDAEVQRLVQAGPQERAAEIQVGIHWARDRYGADDDARLAEADRVMSQKELA